MIYWTDSAESHCPSFFIPVALITWHFIGPFWLPVHGHNLIPSTFAKPIFTIARTPFFFIQMAFNLSFLKKGVEHLLKKRCKGTIFAE